MKIKVMFLGAMPDDRVRLRLGEEFREIRAKIRASKHRDRIELVSDWAVRPRDLQEILLREAPHVVHFSGHGSDRGELILETDDGRSREVANEALVELFGILKDNIRVVVLNACYSKSQADAITQVIDCAVGMNQEVGDKAAIEFATAFYQGLGFGRDVETAFRLGCNSLKLSDIPEQHTPQLVVRQGVQASELVLAAPDSRVRATILAAALALMLLGLSAAAWRWNREPAAGPQTPAMAPPRPQPAKAAPQATYSLLDAQSKDLIYRPVERIQYRVGDAIELITVAPPSQLGQFRIGGDRDQIRFEDVRVPGYSFKTEEQKKLTDGQILLQRVLDGRETNSYMNAIAPGIDTIKKPSLDEYFAMIEGQNVETGGSFEISNQTRYAVTPVSYRWVPESVERTAQNESNRKWDLQAICPPQQPGETKKYMLYDFDQGGCFLLFASVCGLKAAPLPGGGNLHSELQSVIVIQDVDFNAPSGLSIKAIEQPK